MKQIPLSQGKFALIDDDDFDRVSKFKWSLSDGYAACSKAGRMHRFILNAPKGMQVDHKNHDTLDNRRENIWICTASENQKNNRRWNPSITRPTLQKPQIKLSADIGVEIIQFRKSLPFRISITALVDTLIRAGIAEIKRENKPEAS